MIDTNVLISASLFPNSKIGQLIRPLSDKHTIVLCTVIIDELRDVYKRKFFDKMQVLDQFLNELCFETVYTPKLIETMPHVRDKKDTPILAAAILENIDILVTGDKDFSEIDIKRPEILTPLELITRMNY
jgi:putative PIN family toxin of toxin-antitoxin system